MPKGGPPYLPSAYLKEKGLTTMQQVKDLTYEQCRELGITIEALSVPDENAISLGKSGAGYYLVTLPLRRDAYNRHMDAMESPGWLVSFRSFMESQFGPLANVWRHTGPEGLPWDQAFMVGRYGETTTYWPNGEAGRHRQDGSAVPETLTTRDATRADQWLMRMRFPNGVTVQPR